MSAAAAGAGTEGARGTETERRPGDSVGGWRSLRVGLRVSGVPKRAERAMGLTGLIRGLTAATFEMIVIDRL